MKDRYLTELEKIEKRGERSPLEFMLAIMNKKEATIGIRLEAAKAAAPYVHKKMPMDIVNSGEITIIPPFVPTRGELAKDFLHELDIDDL